MNKQEIKFIRGNKERAQEIRQFMEEQGVRNAGSFGYRDSELIYYYGNNKVVYPAEDSSLIGQLIIDNCEELFLPAKFKYKVGDIVRCKTNGDDWEEGEISGLVDVSGEPYYNVKLQEYNYVAIQDFMEENIELNPYKFQIGDCVKVKQVDGGFLSGRVGVITSRMNHGNGAFYDIKDAGGRIRIDEESLELYDMSQIKVWEDLEGTPLKGYFIEDDSEITEALPKDSVFGDCDRNVAATEEVARAMLAMAQISQLLPYYGGEITDEEWNDRSVCKYVLVRIENEIETCVYKYAYEFLAFHTEDQRDEFLANNPRLVHDLLMIPYEEPQTQNN